MTRLLYPNEQDVVSKVMDGEAILINLKTGIYYSMNEVAGLIWSTLENGASAEQVKELVCAQCNAATDVVGADVDSFIDMLSDEDLVVAREMDTIPESKTDTPTAPIDYVSPTAEKFDDMAEMFALDPPLPSLADQ